MDPTDFAVADFAIYFVCAVANVLVNWVLELESSYVALIKDLELKKCQGLVRIVGMDPVAVVEKVVAAGIMKEEVAAATDSYCRLVVFGFKPLALIALVKDGQRIKR